MFVVEDKNLQRYQDSARFDRVEASLDETNKTDANDCLFILGGSYRLPDHLLISYVHLLDNANIPACRYEK